MSIFPFHVEDSNLLSLSLNILGAEKIWYGIPQIHADKFEAMVEESFPNYRCGSGKQFLTHRNALVSPEWLEEKGIPFTKVCSSIQQSNHFLFVCFEVCVLENIYYVYVHRSHRRLVNLQLRCHGPIIKATTQTKTGPKPSISGGPTGCLCMK